MTGAEKEVTLSTTSTYSSILGDDEEDDEDDDDDDDHDESRPPLCVLCDLRRRNHEIASLEMEAFLP